MSAVLEHIPALHDHVQQLGLEDVKVFRLSLGDEDPDEEPGAEAVARV